VRDLRRLGGHVSEPGSEVARRASGLSTARARTALELAEDVVGVKRVRDQAEAIRAYAKNAGLGLDMQNEAARVKLDAERKAGAILTTTQLDPGGHASLYAGRTTRPAALADFGLTKSQSSRWQQLAAIPDQAWAAFVDEQVTGRHELTTVAALRFAASLRVDHARPPVPPPEGRYRTLVIDPPWPIAKIDREERPRQASVLDYPTMSVEEIAGLPVRDLVDPDGAHVYLWVTHKTLPAGLELLERWGCRYECQLTWVKPTGITPYSWMYNTEHVLFARAGGRLDVARKGIKLAFDAPTGGHSTKPDRFYDMVRAASPGPRLEMFARRARPDFDSWGDEADVAA